VGEGAGIMMARFLRILGDKLLLIGGGLGAVCWALDCAARAFLLGEGTFRSQLLAPDPPLVLTRLLMFCALFAVGALGQAALARVRKAERKSKECADALGSFVAPVVVTGATGKVRYVNKSFLRMWGYDHEGEVLGRKESDFWRLDGAESILAGPLRKEASWTGEVIANRKKGGPIMLLFSGNVLRDEKGETSGMIGCFIDIGARKREEERITLQRDLATALAATSDLTAACVLSVNTAVRATGLDWGAVYLVNENDGGLDLEAHEGLTAELAKELAHYDAESMVTQAVMTNKPAYTTFRDLGVHLGRASYVLGERAVAVIPMSHRGRTVGALFVGSRTLRTISWGARNVLEATTGQIGSALVRIRANRALQDREERFRNIFAESPVGMQLYNAEAELLDANKSALELFGVSTMDDLRGFKLFDEPALSREAREMLQAGESVRNVIFLDFDKLEVTSKSGTAYLEVGITPVGFIPARGPSGYLVHAHDVTRHKRIEDALQRSEAHYREILETAVDMVYMLDRSGRFTFVSKGLADSLGYKAEELIGRKVEMVVAGEDREGAAQASRDCLEGKDVSPREFALLEKGGGKVPAQINWNPIYDLEGNIVGTQAMLNLRDVRGAAG